MNQHSGQGPNQTDEYTVSIYDLDYEILESDIPYPLPSNIILLLHGLMMKYPNATESQLAKYLKTEIQNTLNKEFYAMRDETLGGGMGLGTSGSNTNSGTSASDATSLSGGSSLSAVDSKFCWHVIVGKEFGCFGTCEMGTYLHFRLNNMYCCIWAHA